MNRILFEPAEISDGKVSLAQGDARAVHIIETLKASPGKILKSGVVNGLTGESEVLSVSNGIVELAVRHDRPALAPWVDLILAPPRPRAFKRLLPQLAQMGAGAIHLVGAEKVEKMFWGATILKEEEYRPLLVEALMQCGTTALPQIQIHRNFRKFMASLPEPSPEIRRLVAHPYAPSRAPAPASRTLLAIGPEGGWTDGELALLASHGFSQFSLTPRILRTDTAAIAILGALMAQ